MNNTIDFYKDLRTWTRDNPDNAKVIKSYNRGLITIPEALLLINNNNLAYNRGADLYSPETALH